MGELVKSKTVTVLSPYVPAVAEIRPLAFRMYATPPPRGFTYNQYRSGSNYGLPNSPETFANWTQLVQAPTEYTSVLGGYKYRTVEELFGTGTGSIAIPGDWIAVYGQKQTPLGIETVLLGYRIPVMVSQPLPPRWYGPIGHMDFVVFPDVPTAPNGYPLVDAPCAGYFEVPTVNGLQRVWRTYVKDSRGVWMPQQAYPDPPYCATLGACRIVMLANFPGAPAIPAKPAVRVTDFNVGWNSGANSVQALDGDVFVRFFVDLRGAAAVGFFRGQRDPVDYRALNHAFYFDTDPSTGAPAVAPMERGRLVGPRRPYTAATAFELRRQAGVVRFLIDDGLIHTSNTLSGGPVRVGSALYHGDDRIH